MKRTQLPPVSVAISSFFKKINLLIYYFGCIGSLLLHVAFSSCSERGPLFVVVRGLLIVVASLVAELGL